MHVHSMTPIRIKTPKASRVQSYCHSYCHTKCHRLSVTCCETGFFSFTLTQTKIPENEKPALEISRIILELQ